VNARRLSALLAVLLTASLASAQLLNIDTFAGGTTGGGFANGTGVNARFAVPRGIAADPSGNLYVADTANHVIRKIDSAGGVTTLAGLPDTEGFADGTGSAARFRYPTGIAYDPITNTVIVADENNHAIRRVTQGGVVTTIAGLGGTSGTANGTGSAARFTFPRGVTVDNTGVIYVADLSNHVIRKITAAGEVTTFTGSMRVSGSTDGFNNQALFEFPYDVVFDPSSGNLYVSDTGNNTIRRVTPEGRVTTVAGNPVASGDEDGTGSDALFSEPWGIDVDSAGNIYVADNDNAKIRKITPAGVVTTVAGDGFIGNTNGSGASARFNSPSGLTMAPGNVLFVTDGFNFVIRRVTLTGETSTHAGSMPSNGSTNATGTEARFHFPSGIALDAAGNAYVTDSNCSIRKINPAGVVSLFAGVPGQCGATDGAASQARFRSPTGIGIAPDGTIYVADTGNNTIRKITPAGVVSTLAGSATDDEDLFRDGTGAQARFNFPYGLAVDNLGKIYVADGLNHRIRHIEPNGVVTTFAGSGIRSTSNGTGTSAGFDTPLGIAVDSARNIYVADYGNNSIRKITQGGVVTTVAGSASGSGGYLDATGSAARFNRPTGVAPDGQGNLYVADTNNHIIRRISASGAVTTVAGKPFIPGNVNGTGPAARFTFPEALVVTQNGRVLIADVYNHAIRIGTLGAPIIESFTATPRSMREPQGVTLAWRVTGATNIIISGVGNVAATGEVVVRPQVTTTYTLRAEGPGGTVEQQVTVFIGVSRRRAARH
jgi:sugar lactone lactonase YvrE